MNDKTKKLLEKAKPGWYLTKGKRLQEAWLVRVDLVEPSEDESTADYVVNYVICSGEHKGLRKQTDLFWFVRWYKQLDIEAFSEKFQETKDRLEAELSKVVLLANEINNAVFTKEEQEPDRCIYDVCWQGRCKNKVQYEGEQFCEEHRDKMCSKCKTNKAVRDCHQHAGSMICGAPLCEACQHNH